MIRGRILLATRAKFPVLRRVASLLLQVPTSSDRLTHYYEEGRTAKFIKISILAIRILTDMNGKSVSFQTIPLAYRTRVFGRTFTTFR